MLKYVSKFFLEILPSVVATVVGAYIVNHYIAPRNYYGDAPRAAAVSHVDSPQPAKGTTADLTTTPAPVVAPPAREPKPAKNTDKGTDKAAAAAKAQADKVQADKAAADAAKETLKDSASKPELEPRRFVTRDKSAERPPQPAPAETASIAPATVTAPTVPDDHPDAAELARAALDRLRTAEPARPAEAAPPAAPVVVHETPRDSVREPPSSHVNVVTAVPAEPHPAVPPLPPPVSVAAPTDRTNMANGSPSDGSRSFPRASEADRLVPPADIPASTPIDLQPGPAPAKKKSVAEDMLSAARSVFQSVVPQ